VAAVFHEEAGRLTAALVKRLGDFDLAEECVQDALVAALEHWPRTGIPDNPGAWLMTTAHRKGIDRLRREDEARAGEPAHGHVDPSGRRSAIALRVGELARRGAAETELGIADIEDR